MKLNVSTHYPLPSEDHIKMMDWDIGNLGIIKKERENRLIKNKKMGGKIKWVRWKIRKRKWDIEEKLNKKVRYITEIISLNEAHCTHKWILSKD